MSQQRPNVLVFFTDQQRWDTCGCYGNSMSLTPNLDAMARRGTLFQHAFTCQPVCGPARASLQTGMYAEATGVFKNGIALPQNLQTLARSFGTAGYDTGYVGKWHLAGASRAVPKELRGGYDFWLASDVLEFTSHPEDGVIYDGDDQPVRIRGYRVDAMTDHVVKFLRQKRRRPFFLFVSFLEPHFQNDMKHFVAPRGYAERYKDCYVPPDLLDHEGDWKEELPDYYGMCARLDECLGRMLDELQRLKIADNTVVLFTSDHGCHFRTRNREYKRSCHESSIRIPMVADGPGFHGGGTIDQLVSLVDSPPTLLAACGFAVPDQMHGRSMTDLPAGGADNWPEEVFVQISESQVGRAIRTHRWKYCAIAPDKPGNKDPGSDVYVDHHLYDLEADPHEQANLVGRQEHADVLEELRERMKRRMLAAGEKAPQIRPA